MMIHLGANIGLAIENSHVQIPLSPLIIGVHILQMYSLVNKKESDK